MLSVSTLMRRLLQVSNIGLTKGRYRGTPKPLLLNGLEAIPRLCVIRTPFMRGKHPKDTPFMRKPSPDYAWKETRIHNKIHQNAGEERKITHANE